MTSFKKIGKSVPTVFMACICAFLAFSSCKKSGPTIAIITVVDTVATPVPNASITLWQDTSHSQQTGEQAEIRVTKASDASGKAEFEFSLEAYLNIQAIKNGDTAKGFIRLKEHETETKTVSF